MSTIEQLSRYGTNLPTRIMLPALPGMDLWAFLENSDFQRRTKRGLYRQDEVALIGHDTHLDTDYQLMRDIGCVGIRDAARWYLTNPARNQFDWQWMDRMVVAAEQHNLQLYIDLWHYGYPDWLDMMSSEAVDHFAEFARQISIRYSTIQYYCVCNEPSLLVEMGGRRGEWGPFLYDAEAVRRQVCKMIIRRPRQYWISGQTRFWYCPNPGMQPNSIRKITRRQ